jgi:hypothetical protein
MIITNRNFILEDNYLETIQKIDSAPINIPKIKIYEKIKYNYFIKEFYI